MLDHANASFASASDANSLTINLGTFSTGSGMKEANFSLYNLVSTAGFTAPLVYVSASGTGNTSALSTNIASAFTSALAAGSSLGLSASLNTATAGTFSATYTLNLSDATTINGATGQAITLTLSGKSRGTKNIFWTGSSNLWDVGTTSNWTDLSSSEVFLNGDTTTFDDSHASNHIVNLNSTVTPAAVVVNNNIGASYIISGTGSIAGTGSLTKNGTGTLTISSSNSYSGPTTVNAGTLILVDTHAIGNGSLSISTSATAKLAVGIAGKPVVLPAVSIAGGASPTGTLDIGSSKMVITNPDFATAQAAYSTAHAQVANAFDGFAWDLPGITSSQVQTDINVNGIPTAVGIVLNNDTAGGNLFYGDGTGGFPQFAGVSVDSNSILFKYTYLGDSNLDGMVDAGDFNLFQAGYSDPTLAAQLGWAVGDYDYSGTVDAGDFNLFQAGYNYYSNNPVVLSGSGSGGVQPVPEPSGIVLSAIGVAIGVAFAMRLRIEKPGGLSTAGLH